MEIFANLQHGFVTVLKLVDVTFPLIGTLPVPVNILLCFVGCLVGTLIGVLPGVGPIATITMLLPVTFSLDPVGALIMLAGIYYGAQYGGSTTAILVNIPGEATSVVTAIDGHEMAKKGRAGAALGIAAIGSFFAGTVATLVIAALAAPLTGIALKFGPAEYFSLMLMGLVFAVVLARGSILKAVAMIFVGVLLSFVGTDIETGRRAHDLRLHVRLPTASNSRCWRWASSASPRCCAISTSTRIATSPPRASARCCRRARISGNPPCRCCAAR